MNAKLLSYSTDSLSFSWNQSHCQEIGGKFACYKYKLTDTSNGEKVKGGCIENIAETRVIFSLLTPCTSYTFSIKVLNGLGPGVKKNSRWTSLQAQTDTAGKTQGFKKTLEGV